MTDDNNTKICKTCKIEKDVLDFSFDRKPRRRLDCKKCCSSKYYSKKVKISLRPEPFLRRLENLGIKCDLNEEQARKIYNKWVYENNIVKNKGKIECECGSVVSRHCLSKHKKSKKHNEYIKEQEEGEIIN